jgi:FAD-linked sulfhydryl oxidase
MADDIQDENQDGKASASLGLGLPPKKLPKGMILGKDGKP